MSQKQFFSSDQIKASDPSENIWVQANAGTGKTKALIQRLLRILFRSARYDDVSKSGILCLTYTNAAASEMRNRILGSLRDWSMANDEDLTDLLEYVSENHPVTQQDLEFARKIFFTYIDNPDILKIKTIHSFCEEILHRFPLEAGLSPTWSLVSGAAQTVLLDDAFNRMIKQSFNDVENAKNTIDAFYKIIDIKSEYFLQDLRDLLLGRYRYFFQVDDVNRYREYFVETTKKILNIEKEIDIYVKPNYLKDIVKNLVEVEKNKKKPAQYIQNLIDLTQQYIESTIDFEKYKSGYLTKDSKIIKNVLKHDFLVSEAERVFDIQQYLLNKTVFDNTMALFDLSMNFASVYKQIKQEQNLLDFEDLILYTQKLFMKPDVMGWVLSQLDVSLSHILVDEAQDTSPQQWNILRMLAGDFFTDGTDANNRSLFVVGDTKQSIYGFQNADPGAFAASRYEIEKQIKNNYRTIQEVSLDQSFRSVEPILKTVDFFFNNKNIIERTGFVNNNHVCFRQGQKGLVEIHDVFKCDETGVEKNRLYVRVIADKIEQLVKQQNYNPKNIMVLVQKRSGFVDLLSKMLKKKGIDIAGNDRIKLPEFSAIKDMLHLIRFCIDNENDYSLCCILKSPFYRLKERDIFNLCKIKNNDRNTDNKLRLIDVLHDVEPGIYNDLMDTVKCSTSMAPYSFFTYVLNKNNCRQKFISALDKHVIDPIEEFLTICLAYERTQPGTLKHFLKWFITGDSEIKRDMDASQGVRIMTVHGSKGLSSPTVFLIDTMYFPKSEPILNANYLHDDKNYDIWLWNTGNSEVLESVIQKNKQETVAEYYRLLYVAMTRAADNLYVYGCDMDRASDIVWHKQLWSVLSEIKDARIDNETIRITNDTKFE